MLKWILKPRETTNDADKDSAAVTDHKWNIMQPSGRQKPYSSTPHRDGHSQCTMS